MQKLTLTLTAVVISSALVGCATMPIRPCKQSEIPHAAVMRDFSVRQSEGGDAHFVSAPTSRAACSMMRSARV
ncbi:hypothetical protein J2X54_000457 [Duganella sp. 3397]|nr:hypothetical protein [Duganella sp. 3397]